MQQPSQNEINAMGNLLSVFDDIEQGVTPRQKVQTQYNAQELPKEKTTVTGKKYVPYVDTSAQDFARASSEMNNLLESLSNIVDDYNPHHSHVTNEEPDYSHMANEYNSQFSDPYDDNSYDPYEEQRRLDALSAKMASGELITPKKQQQVHQVKNQSNTIKSNGQSWNIVEENVQGLKNAKTYKIVNAYDEKVLMDNIMMYESAYALLSVLNKGYPITNPKILGIISMGLQYTSAVTEMIKYARERQKVLNESNYSRAQEIDSILVEKKTYANSLKNDVLAFLRSEGFIK